MAATGGSSATAEVSVQPSAGVDAAAHVVLVVRSPAGDKVVRLHAEQAAVIGRRPPSDVIVNDPSISRTHLRVCFDGVQVQVQDLSSRNGTRVCGKRLAAKALHRVHLGQVVTAGSCVFVAYRAPDQHEARVDVDTFLGWVALELERARATETSVSVLAIRNLERAAFGPHIDSLKAALRPLDRVAVLSSTGILVLAPGCDASHAERLANQLVSVVAPRQIGVGVAVGRGETARDLVVRAQEAVGRMQKAGVSVASFSLASHLQHGTPNIAEKGNAPVARSKSMQRLLRLAVRAAQTPVSVLILGETGTGKEVVGQFIHSQSKRADKPLVAVNCGAIPHSLLSSTLFGHVRGAFTGANDMRAGVFEQADGGTLFLDEIGELSLDAQVSLLRVLETGRVTRVGGTRELQVDVRLIAATHRDLLERVAHGMFREDLLYRLNPVTLHVEPLRQRQVDIRPLADSLLTKVVSRWGLSRPTLTEAAIASLEQYAFPGNVRELRNVLEHAVVACEGTPIVPEHLPPFVHASGAERNHVVCTAASFRQRIEEHEASLIREALDACGGNQTRAAQLLQIPRRTLVHKLRAYRVLEA